jgi:hypothetical protein
MFKVKGERILNSLPEDLPENETKLFYRIFGEHRPQDFFKKTNQR